MNDDSSNEDHSTGVLKGSSRESSSAYPALLPIPHFVRELFIAFPLNIYPSNVVPAYDSGASFGKVLRTSGNPYQLTDDLTPSSNYCLEWQTVFRTHVICSRTKGSTKPTSTIQDLPVMTSSNDSLPTNSLTSSVLDHWMCCGFPSRIQTLGNPLEAAYHTLLASKVRRACLYAIYTQPSALLELGKWFSMTNFSSSIFVQCGLMQASQLAAVTEITNTGIGVGKIDVKLLFDEAAAAWKALSIILNDNQWFANVVQTAESTDRQSLASQDTVTLGVDASPMYNDPPVKAQNRFEDARQAAASRGLKKSETRTGPGFLDGAVFAYSHLILELFRIQKHEVDGAHIPGQRLAQTISIHSNLLEHRLRMLGTIGSQD